MIFTAKPDFSDLTDDGDTLALSDRFSLRLDIRPDEDTRISDFDCYGKIEWTSARNDYGWPSRPDGFDGAARIVERDRGSVLWWQPWEGASEEDARKFLPTLGDLIRFGFDLIGLTLVESVTDSTGSAHEVDVVTEWLGGVEAMVDDAYRTEILDDLWWQVRSAMRSVVPAPA